MTVPERMELAAEVGSDVPLFLVGGSVLGEGGGSWWEADEMPARRAWWCRRLGCLHRRHFGRGTQRGSC